MRQYFGTDGVRGIVGEDLTTELVQRLGKAATLWSKEVPGGRSMITWNSPRSSTGTNSVPMNAIVPRLATKTAAAAASVFHGWYSAQASTAW